MFLKFISEKDLDNFLAICCLIKEEDASGWVEYQLDGPTINKLFGLFDKFEAFIENQDEAKWATLKEFKTFYNKAKEEGSRFFEFDFTKIDTSKIRQVLA